MTMNQQSFFEQLDLLQSVDRIGHLLPQPAKKGHKCLVMDGVSSALGPLLSVICISDLPNVSNVLSSHIFNDHINSFNSSSNLQYRPFVT